MKEIKQINEKLNIFILLKYNHLPIISMGCDVECFETHGDRRYSIRIPRGSNNHNRQGYLVIAKPVDRLFKQFSNLR